MRELPGSWGRSSACCSCSPGPYALWFHFCAGIRHLVWDTGYGLELPQVYLGGWIVVGASVGLTILTWIVALIVW